MTWGLPGFGKTQLALRYFSLFKNEYTHAIWVDASSSGSMRDAFLTIAQQIDHRLSPDMDSAKAVSVVKQFLAKLESGRWLMIIDSYDNDSFDIRAFFPSDDMRSGSILLTSIRSKMADHLDARGVEIKGLSESAGREILFPQKRTKLPSDVSK